jgi:hypothetical protein
MVIVTCVGKFFIFVDRDIQHFPENTFYADPAGDVKKTPPETKAAEATAGPGPKPEESTIGAPPSDEASTIFGHPETDPASTTASESGVQTPARSLIRRRSHG